MDVRAQRRCAPTNLLLRQGIPDRRLAEELAAALCLSEYLSHDSTDAPYHPVRRGEAPPCPSSYFRLHPSPRFIRREVMMDDG